MDIPLTTIDNINVASSSEAQSNVKMNSASKKGRAKEEDEDEDEEKQESKPAFTLHDFMNKPLQYAPERSKEDHWAIVYARMKPLMDKDKAQCENWKDEVANLLIFAGLFSAVVTAFVVESYKTAQQDPNVVLIGLLYHIANRLDSPLNNNGTLPLPLSPSPDSIVTAFTQTSSSTRINVFWFLSLILSLTTVLIGTISLQWLRQHLSYADLTPKQIIAVFRMRSKSLEAWYVPQIFSALPLLLQSSLVLFFAGMVDFVLLLGNSIAIPVCVLMGITLLLLLTTTALPTLQGFVMYFPPLYPHKTVPAPCPYKSPQSQVFQRLSTAIFLFLNALIPILSHPHHAVQSIRSAWSNYSDSSNGWIQHSISAFLYLRRRHFWVKKHHIISYISNIWCQQTQAKFDLGWLFIRDAYQHGMEDTAVDLHSKRSNLWYHWHGDNATKVFPCYDMIQIIQELAVDIPGSKDADSFLIAAYHSFEEISSTFFHYLGGGHYQSQYFYSLLKSTSNISTILAENKSLVSQTYLQNQLFLCDYLHQFLGTILATHEVPTLDKLREENKMQIMWALYSGKFMRVDYSNTSELPLVCSVSDFKDLWYADGRNNAVTIIDVLGVFFEQAASDNIKKEDLMQSLHTHPYIPDMLTKIADSFTSFLYHPSPESQDTKLQYISQCNSLFKSIGDYLNKELQHRQPESSASVPGLLFYLVSMFVQPFVQTRNLARHFNVNSLLDIMRRYKELTPGQNIDLEERFNGIDIDFLDRFCDDWWADLLNPQASPLIASQFNDHDIDSISQPDADVTSLAQSVPPLDLNNGNHSKVPETLPPIHPDAINSHSSILSVVPQDSVIDMPISPSLESQADVGAEVLSQK